MSTIGSTQLNGAGSPSEVSAIGTRPTNVRHSLDLKYFDNPPSAASEAASSSMVSPATSHVLASPPKLQQSYSANDVTTVKSTTGSSSMASNANNHAQQHLHNHNASLGRIPAGAMPNRHSRELSNDTALSNGRDNGGFPSITSTLHANAAPFGPVSTQPYSSAPAIPAITSPNSAMPYPYYPAGFPAPPNGNAAAFHTLPMLMQGMTIGGGNVPPAYANQNYTGYNPLYTNNPRPVPDSQARVIQSRRQMDSEGKVF